MSQIFHPAANALARLGLSLAVLLLGGALALLVAFNRSDYVTRMRVIPEQPVPFSHQHHVQGLGLDCRYCHFSVEEAAVAGMPATDVCMGCHSQIWSRSPMLEPVRRSLREDMPLRWIRVHDLPDHVYFDHSIHLAKGVGCSSCHGAVERMPLTWKVESMTMAWCLECHKEPGPHLRPQEALLDAGWDPESRPHDDSWWLRHYGVDARRMRDCSLCHR